ncbi:MAG: TetR/AcrR family transcriptional regulator [Pseudomonadales bacterium]|jgi:AcrR family transcriptional regulator|tara:strand:+ start:503 stop:1162 length:660 start_codon:yes stop_codon:yes gene_type:complete
MKSQFTGAPANTPSERAKKTQVRTELARAKMVAAATPMFSQNGYDATSVREIEVAADVKRGMLVYHFGTKEQFWKAVADNIFNLIADQRKARVSVLPDMAEREGIAMIIRFHVRASAQHPEISRLLAQEARQQSWRIEYLVQTHIKPGSEYMKQYVSKALSLTEREFAHWYYIMVSACATIFSFEPECNLLFGFESLEDTVIETHGNMLVDMLLGPSPH